MNTSAATHKLAWFFILYIMAGLAVMGQKASPPLSVDGIALAIVYDTSGSMLDQVKDGSGQMVPKYRIASRALVAITDRLQALAAATPKEKPCPIHSGLIVFDGDNATAAVKFGPFDPQTMVNWLKTFSHPQGSTPLGEAVRLAGQTVLSSNLTRKHVLILTDGVNTRGADPAAVIPRLVQSAGQRSTTISFHFVAFDVDAQAFTRVKKLGATVVAAADEKQLNTQLEFILEEKILLEAETPPNASEKKK